MPSYRRSRTVPYTTSSATAAPFDRAGAFPAASLMAALLAALLAWGAIMLAVAPAHGAAPAREIAVTGRVLGSRGAPLAEAEVILLPSLDPVKRAVMADAGTMPKPAAKALTDPQGYFRLATGQAGIYEVRVQAPGYVPAVASLEPLIEPIDLPDVSLHPDAGLSVRAVGPDGKPLAGARLRLAPIQEPRFFRQMGSPWRAAERAAVTDAEGMVRLASAEKETAALSASAPGTLPAQRRNIRGTSATLQLKEGVPRRIKVVSAEGAPVPGVLVRDGSFGQTLGFTDESGHLTLTVPKEGALEIALTAPDGRIAGGSVAGASSCGVTGAPATGATDAEQAADAQGGGSVTGDAASSATRAARGAGASAPPRLFTLPSYQQLRGRLIDERDRRAVAGGLVWLQDRLWDAALTDAAGGFTLRGPAASQVAIDAGAVGFMPARNFEFALTADGRSGPTIALEPAAAIEGMVLDDGGRPVSGAEVGLQVKRGGDRMIVMFGREQAPPRAVTSSRGTFRLSPVDADNNYDLKVRAAGFAPGGQDVMGLEARRTMSGLRVVLDRGQSVIGRVVDAQGAPITDADLALRSARKPGGGGMMMIVPGETPGASSSFKGTSDAEGRFSIAGIPSGLFDLEVKRAGFARKNVAGVDVAKRGEPIDVGAIVLEPGERVFGFVNAPDGTPVEGAEITLAAAPSGPVMVIGGASGPKQPPIAVSGPDGSFQVEDLKAGEPVNLNFESTGYLPAKETGIGVPRSEPILITMSPASRVSGTVLGPDRKPIPGAEVSLSRSTSGGIGNERFKMITREDARADDAGRFEFESVRPGQIALAANASGWQEAKLEGVEVPQGQDVGDLELLLKQGAVVSGRITAPDGRPVIGARLGPVSDDPEPLRIGGAMSDGDGFYRIEGLAPGRVSIEATHDDHVRTVKEIEARAGSNTLNMQFEGGQDVSGVVTDESGTPIAGAWVRLAAPGREWGGPETKSASSGTFKLVGVGDGDYVLYAGREGFAPSDDSAKVQVAGKPVTGLSVRLASGSTIAGSVTGLERDVLGQVEVRAWNTGRLGSATSTPDAKGQFRMEHLAAGNWVVTASIPNTGRQARAEATVGKDAPEARVELPFGAGLTLSGRALLGDNPVKGASIFAQGTDVNHQGRSRTDTDGAFTIDGLEAGTYRIELRQWESGVSHDETVDVTANREVTLRVPTARVIGRVVDGADRRPIAGVLVTLTGEAAPERRGPFDAASATSDLNGRFQIGNVPDGTWTLTANKGGYAAATTEVTVESGNDMDDVSLALDATDGITLEVRHAAGRVPDTIDVAVLDGAGRTLTSGSYATGENGRVRLSSVPAGSWDLVVGASGSGAASLNVRAPGPPVAIALAPACRLKVTVPELAGTRTAATATIEGADGRPFRSLGWMGEATTRWRLTGGEVDLDDLPPGSWTVKVAGPDGQNWSGSATTSPGTTAEAVLR